MSNRKAETRRRILETAWRLLETHGARRVRLEDVAATAGVTRQSIYDHFGSRTGLLVEMTQFVNQETRLGRLAEPVRAARSGGEQLAAFIQLQSVHTPRIAAVARATDEARRHDEAIAAAWKTPIAERRRASAAIVRRLREEGHLAQEWSVAEATEFLLVLTGIRMWEDLVVDGGWSPEQYVRNVGRVARRSLIQVRDRPASPSRGGHRGRSKRARH